jgi:hypothetical protein
MTAIGKIAVLSGRSRSCRRAGEPDNAGLISQIREHPAVRASATLLEALGLGVRPVPAELAPSALSAGCLGTWVDVEEGEIWLGVPANARPEAAAVELARAVAAIAMTRSVTAVWEQEIDDAVRQAFALRFTISHGTSTAELMRCWRKLLDQLSRQRASGKGFAAAENLSQGLRVWALTLADSAASQDHLLRRVTRVAPAVAESARRLLDATTGFSARLDQLDDLGDRLEIVCAKGSSV